ncbi:hypothetical protein [Streptomyces albidoflavus]|uniref:hypothetical protein n=1 Tax=Streptomyces albidoflavus TaxID=1886 RepID=UPI0033DD5B97
MAALMIQGDVQGVYSLRAKKWRDKSAKDSHGHSVTAALATSAVRNGWSFAQYRDALLDGPSKGGVHARDVAHRKGYDKAAPYLQRVWDHALTIVGESSISDRKDARADLIALRDRISSTAWRGRSPMRLRVLLAHWRAAYKAGGRSYTLSYREAAEEAGCQLATAHRVTKWLQAKWLRLMQSGQGETGSSWYLRSGGPRRDDDSSQGDLDLEVLGRLMGLDAFAHRGLGTSSLKILAALSSSNDQDARDLQESASMSRATVYRHAKLLTGFGFTEKVDEVWTLTQKGREALSGELDGWEAVAVEVGTQGVAQRRLDLHKAQREAWLNETLPRLSARRMPDVVPVRGDEPPADHLIVGNQVIDPRTGEVIPDLVVADDGRLMLVFDGLAYA